MGKLGVLISSNIRRVMKQKNIKHQDLAKKLGKTTTSLSVFFTRLEKGGASNIKTLNEIAEALDVYIAIFFEK